MTAVVLALLLAVAASAATTAWPRPENWRAKHYPRWFVQAMCIHRHEGAWNANTGNGYYGGMQFLESTWKRAGGYHHPAFDHPGDWRYPFSVSPREQLYRARVIWRSGGKSWREWGTAWRCT